MPKNSFIPPSDYGEDWLDTREGTFTDNVPRQEDFSKAASILRIMREHFLKSSVQVDGMFTSKILQNCCNKFTITWISSPSII